VSDRSDRRKTHVEPGLPKPETGEQMYKRPFKPKKHHMDEARQMLQEAGETDLSDANIVQFATELAKMRVVDAYSDNMRLMDGEQAAGVDRRTISYWMRSDPSFKARIDRCREILVWRAEETLMRRLEQDDLNAAIFVLRHLKKDVYSTADQQDNFDPGVPFGKKINITVNVPRELMGGTGTEPVDPKLVDVDAREVKI